MKKKDNINNRALMLAQGAMIAAIYALTTYLSAVFGVAYGPVQIRFSEALTVLPCLTPAAIPGLAVGCLIANTASPYGIWDLILGTGATLLAAVLTRLTRNITIKDIPVVSLLMPVICNALIIGAEVTFCLSSEAESAGFLLSAGQIALGEAGACILLGIPVFLAFKKSRIFRNK